jgi:hypothetical protein
MRCPFLARLILFIGVWSGSYQRWKTSDHPQEQYTRLLVKKPENQAPGGLFALGTVCAIEEPAHKNGRAKWASETKNK